MIWQNLLYGFILGIGFIVPGVSGGVIATILGIYEEIIDKLININKDLTNNLKYILPLLIGIILSILLFSKVIIFLLDNELQFISYVFIGLILGSVPFLYKEIKVKTHKNISWFTFLITFCLGIFLFIIENNLNLTLVKPNMCLMFIAGIFYAIGKIVPGISGASLLMLIGVYKYLLEIIANPLKLNITIITSLIPFIISFIISAIFILKLIDYLLKYHFRLTYSAIIGFVISSIIFIYPGIFTFKSLIITILAFMISYNLTLKK